MVGRRANQGGEDVGPRCVVHEWRRPHPRRRPRLHARRKHEEHNSQRPRVSLVPVEWLSRGSASVDIGAGAGRDRRRGKHLRRAELQCPGRHHEALHVDRPPVALSQSKVYELELCVLRHVRAGDGGMQHPVVRLQIEVCHLELVKVPHAVAHLLEEQPRLVLKDTTTRSSQRADRPRMPWVDSASQKVYQAAACAILIHE